jgi:RNA polymerase sigma-70 factor (sigma-E family)
LDCPDGFMEFMSAAAPRLRRTAYLLCGDWHAAQDLTQATLVRVFVGWHRIREPGNAHAYAQRTLVNSYLAGRRRKSSTEVVSGDLADRAGPPATADLRIVLMQALGVLTPRARAVVVLRYWEDRSVEQVAALLGCSAGNVTSQSTRALAKLRVHLGDSWLELCSAD